MRQPASSIVPLLFDRLHEGFVVLNGLDVILEPMQIACMRGHHAREQSLCHSQPAASADAGSTLAETRAAPTNKTRVTAVLHSSTSLVEITPKNLHHQERISENSDRETT
jgi:hypothetical protein